MESDNDDGSAEGGAAKIYFDLIKNKVPLLNMELRYKGDFSAFPQFFAGITPEFKKMIKEGDTGI